MKKEPKKTNNNVEKLQNKWIAKLRRIMNRDKLKKEDLIISSNAEHLNNNTNDDDNNNSDTHDDT